MLLGQEVRPKTASLRRDLPANGWTRRHSETTYEWGVTQSEHVSELLAVGTARRGAEVPGSR